MSIEGDYAKDFEHVDQCSKPPAGWYCTRAAGHDGPCAAYPQNHSVVAEQAPPKDSGKADCWLLVMKDMEERRVGGIQKYGQPVMPFNGRKALIDAYQECLDMAVYLRQAIEEMRIDEAALDAGKDADSYKLNPGGQSA
jgi:hypothetical protein